MQDSYPPFSCDTLVALPGSTRSGQLLFGKNSDRPQEEAQPLIQVERRYHDGGDSGAQFVAVPQARETYRHVGSRPYWCSGYEHGFNEHQVVIGNEALPTRLRPVDEPKLVGMEIVRLALERSQNAAQAVDVMTALIAEFGQGKFANHAGVRTYDNSFIIADPREAFVLEAAGHDWAVKAANQSTSISNACTLGAEADRVSPGARRHAIDAGLLESGGPARFSFSQAFADPDSSTSGTHRQHRTSALLRAGTPHDPRSFMRILSDHSDGRNPAEPLVEDLSGQVSVCLHRTEGKSPGTTAASLVADLCADGSRLAVYWCALYSPCMSLYMPIFVEGTLPPALAIGDGTAAPDSPWWNFYRLAQSGLRNGAERRHAIRGEWRPLQDELLESAYDVAAQGRALIEDGDELSAHRLLTNYMSENFDRTMSIASELMSSPVG